MLECNGYIMFDGVMQIKKIINSESYCVAGIWLYKPDTNCWYCDDKKYPSEICKIAIDNTK